MSAPASSARSTPESLQNLRQWVILDFDQPMIDEFLDEPADLNENKLDHRHDDLERGGRKLRHVMYKFIANPRGMAVRGPGGGRGAPPPGAPPGGQQPQTGQPTRSDPSMPNDTMSGRYLIRILFESGMPLPPPIGMS